METWILEKLSIELRSELKKKFSFYYEVFSDGTVNASMASEEVDKFIEWCEDRQLNPRLL